MFEDSFSAQNTKTSPVGKDFCLSRDHALPSRGTKDVSRDNNPNRVSIPCQRNFFSKIIFSCSPLDTNRHRLMFLWKTHTHRSNSPKALTEVSPNSDNGRQKYLRHLLQKTDSLPCFTFSGSQKYLLTPTPLPLCNVVPG